MFSELAVVPGLVNGVLGLEPEKVRAVCVEEANRLVVITVYVYYGTWES